MKCRHRAETKIGQNEVDLLLAKMMPRYMAIFPNLSDDMAEILEQKNIFKGLITSILGSAIPTTQLSEIEELGSFLQALYTVLCIYKEHIKGKKTIPDIDKLNPELYYTENELSLIKLYSKEIPEDGDIVEFKVYKCSETHYVCSKITLPEYVGYFNKGAFDYNFNTQRETTKTLDKRTNQIHEKITLFPKNIKKMVEDLKNDKFHPNNLILSIRQNGHEVYDDGGLKVDQYGKLRIQTRGRSHLDINDGMNRTMAFQEYVRQVHDTDKYTGLDIFVCDEREALEIIIQANQGEKIKVESLMQRDVTNAGMTIAKNLNKRSVVLKGKIADDLLEIIAQHKYTDVLTLGYMINEIFGEDVQDKPAKIHQLSNYLADFYDLAIDYYRDYFNKNIVSDIELYQRKNLVAMLVYIAKYIQNEEDWKLSLFNMLENINIEDLLEIAPEHKRLKKKHIKDAINKMEKIIRENREENIS